MDKIIIKCPKKSLSRKLMGVLKGLKIKWYGNSEISIENNFWEMNTKDTIYYIDKDKLSYGSFRGLLNEYSSYVLYNVDEFIKKYSKKQ